MRLVHLILPLGAAFLYRMLTPNPYYSASSLSFFFPMGLFYTGMYHGYLGVFPQAQSNLMAPTLPVTQSHTGRIAIVTGSNTGIGFETAKALAVTHEMTVVLACRSSNKGEAAAEKINSLVEPGKRGKAVFLPLDLSKFSSVRNFATQFKAAYPDTPVHVLVNNAGVNTSGKTTDGLSLLLQVNFYGHFLLTSLLMDVLAEGARVVNLSSVMHHFCGDLGDLTDAREWRALAQPARSSNSERNILKWLIRHLPNSLKSAFISNLAKENPASYNLSKLASVLFSAELNRRFPNRIHSVAVNPGGVNSDIWRTLPRFLDAIFRIIFLTNEDGSKCSVAAAVADLPQIGSQYTPHYLQPYPLPAYDQPSFPVFEALGPFGGTFVSTPRMPKEAEVVGTAMWRASNELTGAKWIGE